MADEEEKTEEPTSKKIDDAKQEGNVPKSAEIPGAAILFFGSTYLIFLSSGLFSSIQNMMHYSYSFIGNPISGKEITNMSLTIMEEMMYALFPFFILVLFLAIITNVMQFGFTITPLKLKLEKIDPISGFKNVFSMKKILEALKLTAKLIVIFIVMLILIAIVWDSILAMMNKDVRSSLDTIIQLTMYFVYTILLIIIIFAFIDLVFTRYYYFKQLKMSKQEIKDEHKQMEGDPIVKGRIRQIQMKMAKERMMQDVPNADVVITNPSHIAIALKYDQDVENSVPYVVAKGRDYIALKIKDIAREHNIQIIEDPTLARALYTNVEVDQQIPEDLYKAIAEIFSYIYSLNDTKK